jgi:hypothetical protein
MFINQAKIFICSVAPPFPMLAAARAGFRLIVSEQAEQVGQTPGIMMTAQTLTSSYRAGRASST